MNTKTQELLVQLRLTRQAHSTVANQLLWFAAQAVECNAAPHEIIDFAISSTGELGVQIGHVEAHVTTGRIMDICLLEAYAESANESLRALLVSLPEEQQDTSELSKKLLGLSSNLEGDLIELSQHLDTLFGILE